MKLQSKQLKNPRLRYYAISYQDIVDLFIDRSPETIAAPKVRFPDLPTDYEVLDIREDMSRRCFMVLISHPSFDELPHGAEIPVFEQSMIEVSVLKKFEPEGVEGVECYAYDPPMPTKSVEEKLAEWFGLALIKLDFGTGDTFLLRHPKGISPEHLAKVRFVFKDVAGLAGGMSLVTLPDDYDLSSIPRDVLLKLTESFRKELDNNLMEFKFEIGQRVKHRGSSEYGTVKSIQYDEAGRYYKVENDDTGACWVSENMIEEVT